MSYLSNDFRAPPDTIDDWLSSLVRMHIQDGSLHFFERDEGGDKVGGIYVERWRANRRRILAVFFGTPLQQVCIEGIPVIVLPDSETFDSLRMTSPDISDRQSYVCVGNRIDNPYAESMEVQAKAWASDEVANQLTFPKYLGYLMLETERI